MSDYQDRLTLDDPGSGENFSVTTLRLDSLEFTCYHIIDDDPGCGRPYAKIRPYAARAWSFPAPARPPVALDELKTRKIPADITFIDVDGASCPGMDWLGWSII